MIFLEYETFNFERSEYTSGIDYGIDDMGILSINKLVLSKEKLSHVDAANNIFALKEGAIIILCTEIAKDMIEAAGIKDVRFRELPVK